MLKLESKIRQSFHFIFDLCLKYFLIRSTFLKQMKLIHGKGFHVDEKRRLVPFIYRQIVTLVRSICRAMRTLGIRFQLEHNEVKLKMDDHPLTFVVDKT